MDDRILQDAWPVIRNHLIDDNCILVRLDADGVVTETAVRSPLSFGWTSEEYYRKYLLGKKIADYFDLPEGAKPARCALPVEPLERLFRREELFRLECSYPSRNLFENVAAFHAFWADYPYSRLYLRSNGFLGLFGIIRFHGILTSITHYRLHPLLLLDREGRVQGFNGRFLESVGAGEASPEKLLGRDVEKFMSPNPLSALLGLNLDPVAIDREPWKKRHAEDRPREWRPSPAQQGLLRLKEPVNTVQNDFRLEINFRVLSGRAPSLIFNGVSDSDRFFPDYNGYLLGMNEDHPLIQIKREGWIVHQAPCNFREDGKDHVLTLIKRGSAVVALMDGKPVLCYVEPEPLTSRESWQYLYHRKEGRIRLNALTVSTLPSAPHLHEGFNEVAFRSGGENAFYFHPRPEFVIPYGARFYYALMFYNISPLKRSIAVLEKARTHAARERDRYRSLALGDEAEKDLLTGESPAVLRIKREVRQIAPAAVTVLIEGETGTGKEVLARFIHHHSPRRTGPFVKVDCSALPETLLESELFGVEKGAFTGATETRPGKLESAAGGTLFLDELSNLNMAVQAKLLNFLQNFTLERLGSTRTIKVDTRIIAATNRPLKALVEKGLFRSDLYYRLYAIRFVLPPLRERREDISLLCRQFLSQFNDKFSRAIKGFSPAAFQKFLAHDWPGNVRELENAVQKAVLFCEKDIIGKEHVEIAAPAVSGGPAAALSETSLVIPVGDPRALTADHVRALLRKHNNIVARAAREAKTSTVTFFSKMKRFGIKVER